MKYTREKAIRMLEHNGADIKRVKVPKDRKKPDGDTMILHIIDVRDCGIKVQGVADFLINHHYDMIRR